MSGEKGFTLIELTLVIVLIAIVSGMAMPGLMDFVFDDPLKKSARKLAYFIQQTASLAEQTSQPKILEYSPLLRTFTLQQLDNPDAGSAGDSFQFPEGVSVRSISFFYSEKEAGEQYQLKFSAKGYLEPCLIYLQNRQEDILTLRLSPFLGRIEVYEEYVAFDKTLFGPYDEDPITFAND